LLGEFSSLPVASSGEVSCEIIPARSNSESNCLLKDNLGLQINSSNYLSAELSIALDYIAAINGIK
jgi:hypothetical protein